MKELIYEKFNTCIVRNINANTKLSAGIVAVYSAACIATGDS